MKSIRGTALAAAVIGLALSLSACPVAGKKKIYTLKDPAALQFKIVYASGETAEAARAGMGEGWNENYMTVAGPPKTQPSSFLVVKTQPDLTGEDLETVAIGEDKSGQPAFTITFKTGPDGRTKMGKLTEENLDRPLAIIVSGRVILAPIIKSKIEKEAVITGVFSRDELQALCSDLGCQEVKK